MARGRVPAWQCEMKGRMGRLHEGVPTTLQGVAACGLSAAAAPSLHLPRCLVLLVAAAGQEAICGARAAMVTELQHLSGRANAAADRLQGAGAGGAGCSLWRQTASLHPSPESPPSLMPSAPPPCFSASSSAATSSGRANRAT